MGEIVGGTIAVFLLHLLWEWLLFRRVTNDPVVGKLAATVAAYATAVGIYGFGAADGGPWNPVGFVVYLPGAIIVAIYAVWKGRKAREAYDAAAFD